MPATAADSSCSCSSKLPQGWLHWVYSLIKRFSTWDREDNDQRLLYEVLACCVDADILVLKKSRNDTLHNIYAWSGPRPNQEIYQRVVDGDLEQIIESNQNTWTRSKKNVLSKKVRFPNLDFGRRQYIWWRKIQGNSYSLAVGCVGNSYSSRICERCWKRIKTFLENPNGSPSLRLTPPGTPLTLPETSSSEPDIVASHLADAHRYCLELFSYHWNQFGTNDCAAAASAVWNALQKHAFAFSVLLNQAVITGFEGLGYGYFLTHPQRRQFTRLSQELYQKIGERLEIVKYGSSDEKKGLIAATSEKKHAFWSPNLFRHRIMRQRKSQHLSKVEQELGEAEDKLVHRVDVNDQTNFIFEAPFFVKIPSDQDSIGAIFFFVLKERPPGPILPLLVLSARMALQPYIPALFRALKEAATSSLQAKMFHPLYKKTLHKGFLTRICPHSQSSHDVEKIFSLTPSEPALKRHLKVLPGFTEWSFLRSCSDVAWLCQLLEVEQANGNKKKRRWLYYLLKCRVRATEIKNTIYVVDLFSYLAGWKGEPRTYTDEQHHDLYALVHPAQWDNIEQFSQTTMASLTLVDDEGTERIMAKFGPKKLRSNGWRQDKVRESFVANPWDSKIPWFDRKKGKVYRKLLRARVKFPKFDEQEPPLCFFFEKLMDEIGDYKNHGKKLNRINVTVNTLTERVSIEALWRNKSKAMQKIPHGFFPDGTTGDYGKIQKTLEKSKHWGWYIQYELQYEGGTD